MSEEMKPELESQSNGVIWQCGQYDIYYSLGSTLAVSSGIYASVSCSFS